MPQDILDLIDHEDLFDIEELPDPRDVRWSPEALEMDGEEFEF
jgi:hypothetical protein